MWDGCEGVRQSSYMIGTFASICLVASFTEVKVTALTALVAHSHDRDPPTAIAGDTSVNVGIFENGVDDGHWMGLQL